MKRMSKQIVVSLFAGLTCLFLCSQTTHAMVKQDRTPKRNSILFNPNIQPTILESLSRAHQADEALVTVDSFILTDAKIIDLLIKIHAKHPHAVTVHLHESNTHNKKTIAQLIAHGIPVEKSHQHAKRIGVQFKNNDEKHWHRHSLAGSYNLTTNARKNKEMMVLSINDSPLQNAHEKSHVQGIKRDRNQTPSELIDSTPDKKLVIDNATHDLHGSIVPRIDNTQEGDTLYFGSMNYGEQRMHEALLKAALRKVVVYMLLDTDAAAQKNIPLLEELDKAGAHIVFPTGKIKTKGTQKILTKSGIFHQKYVVRSKENDQLAYVSTANATEHAQHDFNVSTFFPDEPQLIKNIIESHTNLTKNGITYQQFKSSGAQLPERRKINAPLFNTNK